MDAKKCDRCGRFYDIYNELKLEEGTYQNVFNHLILRYDSESKLLDYRDFDLCPDCMAGVMDWLKHPEKTVS